MKSFLHVANTLLRTFVALCLAATANLALADEEAAQAWPPVLNNGAPIIAPPSEPVVGSTISSDQGIVSPGPPLIQGPLTPVQDPWLVRVGAMLLWRFSPGVEAFPALDRFDVPDSNILDFRFPMSAGVDVAIQFRGPVNGIDFRYFDAGTSSATLHVSNDPALGGGPDYFGTAETYTITSSLQSVELNLRNPIAPPFTWLVGFRYINFNDQLRRSSTEYDSFGTFTWHDTMRTRNNLFGLQLGAEHVWQPGQRFRVTNSMKGIIYGNAADSEFFGNSSWLARHDPYAMSGSAGLGLDLNIAANYRLTEHWSLQAGYQLLLLTNLATATDQFSAANNRFGTFSTNTGGSVLLQGLNLGVQFGW